MRKRDALANSLMEYVLPLGLIAVLGIFSAISLSPSFKQFIISSLGDGPMLEGETALTVKSYGSNEFSETLKIRLENGQIVTVPNYPSDLARSIEVEGSDGTTNTLLASLESLARQLKENGTIDEAGFNALMELANSGYRLARIEEVLETKLPKPDQTERDFNIYSLNAYESDIVANFGGKDFTYEQLSVYLADPPNGDPAFEAQSLSIQPEAVRAFNLPSNQQFREPLVSFFNKFAAAEQSSALRDPAVKAVITSLSDQIQQIARQTSVVSYDIAQRRQIYAPESFRMQIGSKVTDTNSRQICSTGGGSSPGVYCSK